MARRWSKLQKQIYNLIDEKNQMQIHCIDVESALACGSLRSLGLFKIRIGKQIIWDFSKNFVTYDFTHPNGENCFSHSATDINVLFREYIDTPKKELLDKHFDSDQRTF